MLKGDLVILRALEEEDAYELIKYVNDIEILQYLTLYRPLSLQDELEFIRRVRDEMKQNRSFSFAIVDKETNRLIGTIGLHGVDWISRNAELGITIWRKEYWNRGYGTDAMKLLLYYGFIFLNLHRIWLRVYSFNKRAIRAYEKIGFKMEGTLREHIFKNGQYVDVHIMGILRHEFKEKHSTWIRSVFSFLEK
ncbi:MAG: GNAT family N-acetyltransferase [Candidatus Odinarchaeota archaeon]|nr:GNAT family N-acetyltransferase [Candidatus Odinarchaeota archaeon]